jgi:tetratricopeptide (TPR) repeat protein
MSRMLALLFTLLLAAAFPAGANQTAKAPKLAASTTEWERQQFEVALNLIHTGVGKSMEQAYAVLEEIHRKNPSSPYLLAAAAELQYFDWVNRGNVSANELRSLCRRALDLKPDMPDPYVTLAKVEVRAGYPDQADAYADEALKRAPNKREAWFAKAKAQEALGNYAEAERWFTKALNAHTDPARKSNMHSALADLYKNQKPPQIEKALTAYRKSADLDPEHPWKRSQLAMVLNQYTDRHDEAIAAARQSLEISDHRQGREQLAIALYAKWAGAYLDGLLKNGSSKVPAPAAIAQQTGYSVEQMFVRAGWYEAGYRISSAMLKANVIKEVDVLPAGACCNALLTAAQATNLELVHLLVDRGANIHATDGRDHRTALFELATRGNVQGVELLLRKGARVNVVDRNGRPLTHVLAEINTPGCTEVLLKLLQAGADPELPNADGTPLLVNVVRSHNTPVLKVLLTEHQMDPDSKDSEGIPALTWAAVSTGSNRAGNVKLLLEAGANPWVRWGGADVLESVEVQQPENPQVFTETREIAALVREARQRVPKPQQFNERKLSTR